MVAVRSIPTPSFGNFTSRLSLTSPANLISSVYSAIFELRFSTELETSISFPDTTVPRHSSTSYLFISNNHCHHHPHHSNDPQCLGDFIEQQTLTHPNVLYSSASIGQHCWTCKESADVLMPEAEQHLPAHAPKQRQRVRRGSLKPAHVRSLCSVTERSDEQSVNSSPDIWAANLASSLIIQPLRATPLSRTAAQFKPAVNMPKMTLSEARELVADHEMDRPPG